MGALHPQVVRFTIVLAIIDVAFRLVSLLGKPAFASPAATNVHGLAAVFCVYEAGEHGGELVYASLATETLHLGSHIVVDNELALRVPDGEHWA